MAWLIEITAIVFLLILELGTPYNILGSIFI